MKSSKLFLISLLAAAAMSATAYAETDLSGFSGTIYTWAGRNGVNNTSDLAFGYYYTTDESGAFTAITYGNSTNGDANNWQTTVQPIIGRDNASATTGPTYQNTLRFVALDDSSFTGDYTAGTIKTPVYTFQPLTLGGIIVESGATGFSISASGGNNRSFMLGNGDGTAAKSVFHESFTLTLNTGNSDTTNTIRGTQTWTIDENKTFTITSGSRALNFTGATTINGGGTAKLSGSNVSFGAGASINIAANTTLDLSGATFTGNSATFELNGGNIVLGDVSRLGDTALLSASTITATSGSVEFSGIVRNGTYTIFTGTDSATLGTLSLTAANSGYYDQAWSIDGNTISVTISNSVRDLIWSGATNTTWDMASANWKTSAEATESTTFKNYDSVTFNGDATVTVASGGVTAETVTVSSGTLVLSDGTVTASALAGSGTIQLGSLTGLSVGTANDANRFAAWTGTVAFKDISDVSGVGLDLRNYGNENSKIVFDGVSGTGTGQGQGLWFVGATVASDIEIGENGLTLTNGSGSWTTTFSGALSGTGTFYHNHTTTQTYKFTGDVSGFTGTLKSTSATFEFAPSTGTQTFNGEIVGDGTTGATVTKSGAGELTFSASSSLEVETLTVSGGALTFASSSPVNITTANLNSGSTNLSSTGTTSIGSLSMKTGASATQTSGIVTISDDVRLHTSDNATTETYTLSGGVLNITKTASRSIAADTSTDANYNASAIFLGVWKNGKGQLAVQGGTLNVLNSQVVVGFDSSAEVAMSSGEMNVKGVVLYGKNSGKTSKLTVTGGRLNVGSEGLITSTASSSNATKTISISDATVGSLDSWNANGSITLGGTVTFDTTKMVASTAGNSSADATDREGTTITLNGVLSGSDVALKKTGAGTLTLSGDNLFSGGLEIKEGIVVSTRPYSLGSASNVVKIAGGQLKVNAGVTLAQTNVEIALGSAYANTAGVAAIIGAAATASLANNTVVTITELDLEGIALASEAALANSSYEFKILDTISAGENLTFKLSEALRNDWRISGYMDGVLTIAAIPEPSMFGLLAGLGALALAGTRRRRRKA